MIIRYDCLVSEESSVSPVSRARSPKDVQNPELDDVAKAVEDAALTMVQLNGEEGPSFCAEVARKTGVKVIKAVHVSSAADIHAAAITGTITITIPALWTPPAMRKDDSGHVRNIHLAGRSTGIASNVRKPTASAALRISGAAMIG